MTKTQFLKMEKVCKEMIWKPLAKSGDCIKPVFANIFELKCPACEIAYQLSSPDYMDCNYCPVTKWRESQERYACENDYDLRYHEKWLSAGQSNNQKRLKEAATAISKMKWSWLPEYKAHKLSLEILAILKKVKL
jgi:hypothetical protein